MADRDDRLVLEAARIRAMYARRAELGIDSRYELWEEANLFRHQGLERALVGLLARHGCMPLTGRSILDVGCGRGTTLVGLLPYRATPENLFGVDLQENLIAEARDLAPHLDFRAADATALPFEDGSFDVVLASMLLSSVSDPVARETAARELLRVVRPGGGLIVYDFRVNPVNRDVLPIGRRELARLFPGCRDEGRSITLAPPVMRALVRHGWVACELLGTLPFLRTHRLTWIARA